MPRTAGEPEPVAAIPEPERELEPAPEPERASDPALTPEADPREGLLERLRELDRGRRELRQWMEEEPAAVTDGGVAIPVDRTLFLDRSDGPQDS